PWLGRVSSLSLSRSVLNPDELEALLASPHLGRLRRLTLHNVGLTPDGVERLAAWPGLRRLHHLDLTNEWPGDEPCPRHNELRPDGLRVLLGSGNLAGLTSLCWKQPLPDADVVRLANDPQLVSLTHLRLWGCGISPGGARVLGRARGLS